MAHVVQILALEMVHHAEVMDIVVKPHVLLHHCVRQMVHAATDALEYVNLMALVKCLSSLPSLVALTQILHLVT